MQVISLGTDFYPDALVENFTSMIWTERFYSYGEFELKTYDVENTMAALPLNTLIAIVESSECMLVENHAIAVDSNGKIELTVTGRSFETFFENRVARPALNPDSTFQQRSNYLYNENGDSNDWIYDLSSFSKSSVAACSVLNYWAQPTADQDSDVARKFILPYGLGIPNFYAYDGGISLTGNLPNRVMTIKPGDAYAAVLDLLSLDNLGIVNIRPGPEFVNPTSYTQTRLRVQVTATRDMTNTIVFSTAQGHFKNVSYFFSVKDWKNVVWGYSYYRFADKYNTGGPTAAGINRRVGFLDATDIKTPKGSSPYHLRDVEQITERNVAYLEQHKKVVIMDGQVTSNIPYRFGSSYILGDIVQVIGDYGFNQPMLVGEYIRIQDENGEQAYPSLQQLTDPVI